MVSISIAEFGALSYTAFLVFLTFPIQSAGFESAFQKFLKLFEERPIIKRHFYMNIDHGISY